MAISSRPFQSQTFRRLQAGYGRVASWGRRQLNTAQRVASWSLQMVLYPVYVGFQGTRLLYRQLRASSIASPRPAALAADAPAADAPIRDLMATLRGSGPIPGLAPRLPLAMTTQARGIACDRSCQTLVLIGPDHHPQPLTPPQQTALEQLIRWLLSDYAYRWHQYHQRQRLKQAVLPPPQPPTLAWWPIRQLYRLMAWMQQSSVATTIHLFQEHRLLEPGSPPPSPPPQPLPSPRGALRPRPPARPQRELSALPSGPMTLASQYEVSPPTLVPRDPAPATPSPPPALQDPNWIDTQAVLVGYVDHPLVTVLRWLDRILLWVERQAQQLRRWLAP